MATATAPAPSADEIRAALRDRLESGDDYASDDAWIDYLSDGLNRFWPGRTDADGDAIEAHPPALEAMIEAARPRIAAKAQQIAIDELTRIAIAYGETAR